MAFIIQSETKYTPTGRMITHVYPEQNKARQDMRMETAARAYWTRFRLTGSRDLAEDAARAHITADELLSAEFMHILEKRRP